MLGTLSKSVEAVIVGFLSVLSGNTATASEPLRVVSDRTLPASFGPAFDLRWIEPDRVLLARGGDGATEISLDPFGSIVREVFPGKRSLGGGSGAGCLGYSPQFVAASAIRAVLWREGITAPLRHRPEDFIADLDVHGTRLALLGARRDGAGRWAPEGGIAWVGSLTRELADLHPILFDDKGPGAENFHRCGTFDVGALRFLGDGSLVVVPGVQAGAHLYDASGRLRRTWDTVALGLPDDCPRMSREEWQRVRFPPKYYEWRQARVKLEEIVSLEGGVGLILRRVIGDLPEWSLVALALETDQILKLKIPITASHELSFVRADVRGRRLLVLESAYSKQPGEPFPRPARLVELALPVLFEQPGLATTDSGKTSRRENER